MFVVRFVTQCTILFVTLRNKSIPLQAHGIAYLSARRLLVLRHRPSARLLRGSHRCCLSLLRLAFLHVCVLDRCWLPKQYSETLKRTILWLKVPELFMMLLNALPQGLP